MRKATEIISIISAVFCGVLALVSFISAGVLAAADTDTNFVNDLAKAWDVTAATASQAVQLISIYLLVDGIFAVLAMAISITIAVLSKKGVGEHVLVILGVICVLFGFSLIVGILAIITGAEEIEEDHNKAATQAEGPAEE